MEIVDKIDIKLNEVGIVKYKGEEFDADYVTALKRWRFIDFELVTMYDALKKVDDKVLMKRIKKMQNEIKSISDAIKKNM